MSRVVTRTLDGPHPNANIPTVLLPAAEPLLDAAVAAVPALTTSPEYVYLLRVVELLGVCPNAKIPKVPLPAAELFFDATVEAPPAATTSPE